MKKSSFYLLSLFTILLFVVCSCKDDNNDPTPPEPSPGITIPDSENLKPVLPQEGGTVSISFTATADWTANLINTRAESWITINPSSGTKGKNEITITTTANETYDERNATIVLKCGTDAKNIIVTQKQKDALTVTSSKYEVDSKGGNINVEVKANISFEVEIKADWIKQTEKTRALTTSNLNFTIDPNETGEKREGEIVVKSGELSETIKVYQEDGDFITLTKKDFTIPEEGGNVDIEIKSTLNYEVKMLSDVDWITETKTRAVSTHTHHYTISPNDTYDSRETKIVFYDPKDENLADTVSIYQLQKDGIIVAQNEYILESKEGTLSFMVSTNVNFAVSISEDWIKQISTRGLVDKQLNFTVEKNTNDESREAVIIVSNDKLEQHIKVIQKGKHVFTIKQKEYHVSSTGEQIKVEIISTGKYSIQMPAVNWITEITTKAADTNTHLFAIAANKEYDSRSAEIVFIEAESGLTETVKVIQKQQDAIVIKQDTYSVKAEGGTLEIKVDANIEYTVTVSDDWIQQVTSRSLLTGILRFTVAKNENESMRTGSIILNGGDITKTITIKQSGKDNAGGNIDDMPTQPW